MAQDDTPPHDKNTGHQPAVLCGIPSLNVPATVSVLLSSHPAQARYGFQKNATLFTNLFLC